MSLLLLFAGGGGGSVNHADSLSAGAYTISGKQVTDSVVKADSLSVGAYSISGKTVSDKITRADNLSVGAYSISGKAITETVARGDNLSAGAYVISGKDLTDIVVGTGINHSDNLSAGAYSIVGGDVTDAIGNIPRTTVAGRKGYIIKGRRYWLTEQELAVLVAQMLEEIKRKDIQLDDPEKPKNISRKAWAEVKRTLQAIEATMIPEAEPIIRKIEKQFVDEDDDEEVLLMLY